MIKFGCGGNPEKFYNDGGASSIEMPHWLKKEGLDAYELSFKKGIKLSDDAAKMLNEEVQKNGIYLSIHAPAFVNLASPDEQIRKKSLEAAKYCIKLAAASGAKRVVLHTVGANSITRLKAFSLAAEMLFELLEFMKQNGYAVELCPEISGKQCQFGNLDEIVKLCEADELLVPAVNFGHLNARTCGGLKTKEDYALVIKKIIKKLGRKKAENFHSHFSRISYTNSGEKEHLTFADNEYGPFFKPLLKALREYGLNPVIICESFETQAEDAKEMKEEFLSEVSHFG